MRKLLFVSMLFLMFVLPLSAAKNRIAMFEFTIYSQNPEYEHIGKGFYELISLELKNSPGITMVNRRKCTEFLEEKSMAIEDLDDSKTSFLVSEMLKVDYLIMGEIHSTDNEVTINLWMIDGMSGEVVWQEDLSENLSNYEFISASFAQAILAQLNADIPKLAAEKAKSRTGKDEEAFIAFSAAVDYLDRKDSQSAKESLIRAAEIDPESEAIRIYLKNMEWSVEIVSPKFRIGNETHTSAYNPASLGFIDKDQFYLWGNAVFRPLNQTGEHQELGGHDVTDIYQPIKIGYMMPLGQNLGLGVEYETGGSYKLIGADAVMFDYQGLSVFGVSSSLEFKSGNLSVGYRFLDNMSLGASVQVWNANNFEGISGDIEMVANGIYFSVQGGYMLKALEGRLTFDFSTVYSNQVERYVEFSTLEVKDGTLPLHMRASAASDFLNRKLFLSLTGISDIYIDGRGGYVLRAIPVAEYWLFPFFAARTGGEYSHMDQFDEFSIGYGILAGISFKFWKIEINTNFTIRKKPVRFLPGQSYTDWTLLIGGTFTPNFFIR